MHPAWPRFGVGNDLPNGTHFTLNIHGVKDKQAAMDAANANGRGNNTGECWEGSCPIDAEVTNRKNKILLQSGADFAVLDANATDSDGTLFQLPQKREQDVRRLCSRTRQAEPGRSGRTREADDVRHGCSGSRWDRRYDDEYEEVLCSLDNYVAFRDKGKPRAELVTDELLYLEVNIDAAATVTLSTCLAAEYGTGVQEVPLFDSCFESFFWDYDNNGLRLLQLRFHSRES